MYSLTRMGGGMGPHQTRQFSTGPENTFFNKAMPTQTNFLNRINLDRIQLQKRFLNPNFVHSQNFNSTSINSCPKNLKLNPCCPTQLTESHLEYKMAPNSFSVPAANTNNLFNTETDKKEDTHRRKDYRKTPQRDHARSPKKSHKNKMNIDLKYEIDEVGIDVLSDAFDTDSNDNTPTVDIEIPPVFVHEAVPIRSPPIHITIETPEKILLSFSGETRCRLPSECGSEDSFIVFQCSTEDDGDDIEEEDDDDISNDESDIDSDDTDYTDTEDSDDDFLINEKFDGLIPKEKTKPSKKVTFSNDLCKIYPMIKWSYAYQAARKGPWEEYARDRSRFKDRISRLEKIISPILKSDHRQKVYKERYL